MNTVWKGRLVHRLLKTCTTLGREEDLKEQVWLQQQSRRGDQKREVAEILLNLSIRQAALILRSVHTKLILCYSLEFLIYL